MKKANTNTESSNIKITIQEPKHNFIIVYDSVYKNTDLTTDEIALIIKLLASAPTFKPTSRKLADILKIDIKTLTKASKALQQKGYLEIKKFGKNSEWIITQEPINTSIKKLRKNELLEYMLDFRNRFNMDDLRRLHKLKYIDDKTFIEIADNYAKEIQKLARTEWLNSDD